MQIDALHQFGCQFIFKDEGWSGALRHRPGLEQALMRLAPGDELVVWKLDRLGRSLSHLIELVNELEGRRVGLVSLSEAINTNSPGGVLVFHIMAALAQFERALISERTKAGMTSARLRGRRIGRPRKLDAGQVALAQASVRGNGSVTTAANRLGVSRSTVYRALKRGRTATDDGEPPGRGGLCDNPVAPVYFADYTCSP